MKKPQISPLRYAPVPRHAGAGEMTIQFGDEFRISTKGPRNCRSLGYARDDKGKAMAPLIVIAEPKELICHLERSVVK
jgi:hypothetical protein